MIIQSKRFGGRLARIALVTALILSVPFVAMQLTDEVAWTLSDFVVMGGLLFSTGLAYELITRNIDARYRLAVGLVLLAIFLVIWVERAVGVFGTPFAGS